MIFSASQYGSICLPLRSDTGTRTSHCIVKEMRWQLCLSVPQANVLHLYCIARYCTILYCTLLRYTVLHCTVLYCTVLYCTMLYCTVIYCTVLYSTALHCSVKYSDRMMLPTVADPRSGISSFISWNERTIIRFQNTRQVLYYIQSVTCSVIYLYPTCC